MISENEKIKGANKMRIGEAGSFVQSLDQANLDLSLHLHLRRVDNHLQRNIRLRLVVKASNNLAKRARSRHAADLESIRDLVAGRISIAMIPVVKTGVHRICCIRANLLARIAQIVDFAVTRYLGHFVLRQVPRVSRQSFSR